MAATNEKARETISKYLGDLHALTRHGFEAISRQADQLKGADHPQAQRAVGDFKRTLESHIASIEARLKALGGSPTSPVKDAAGAVTGMVAGLYDKVRTEEASKSIRDDYTFISHSSIAYLMLHTTAKSLGDEETAMLADRGYRDTARMITEIDRIMPDLVIQELKQDGLPARDVAEHCHKLVSDAWERGAKQSGMTGSGAMSGTSKF